MIKIELDITAAGYGLISLAVILYFRMASSKKDQMKRSELKRKEADSLVTKTMKKSVFDNNWLDRVSGFFQQQSIVTCNSTSDFADPAKKAIKLFAGGFLKLTKPIEHWYIRRDNLMNIYKHCVPGSVRFQTASGKSFMKEFTSLYDENVLSWGGN